MSDPILRRSTDQRDKAGLLISREENRLIEQAWPFESHQGDQFITDINALRTQVIQYFGISESTQNYRAIDLDDCLQNLRELHNIINVPLQPEADSLLGDSGLLILTYPDGIELIKPSQWKNGAIKNSNFNQVIMLFHGLPAKPASVFVLLKRVINGRKSQLILILAVALIGVLISLVPTWLQSYIFNEVVPNGQRFLMIQIAAFLLCIKLTSSGLKLFNQLVGLRLELYLGLNTTALLVHRLFALPPSFFNQYKTGDLQQRVNSAHALRRALQQSFISIITAFIVVVMNIGLVFVKTFSFQLCLILLVATALGPASDAIAAFIETSLSLKRLNLAGQLQDAILSPLQSIETVRSLGLEKNFTMRFAAIRHRIARLDIQIGLIKTGLRAVTIALNAAVISLLLYLFSSPQTLSLIGAEGHGAIPSQGLVVFLLSAFSTINGGVSSLSTSMLALVKVVPDTVRFRPIVREEVTSDLARDHDNSTLRSLTLQPSHELNQQKVSLTPINVLPGNSVAILHDNTQMATLMAERIAGEPVFVENAFSGLQLIINNNRESSQKAAEVINRVSILISKSPVFTAGSIAEFICNYDFAPDVERMQHCLEALGIDPYTLIQNQRLESGPAASSNLNGIEALQIQVARALYSQQSIVVLDGVVDLLPSSMLMGMIRFCQNDKKMLFFSTKIIQVANACDAMIDIRGNP